MGNILALTQGEIFLLLNDTQMSMSYLGIYILFNGEGDIGTGF